MVEIVIITLIITIGVLVWTILYQNKVIKRQDEKISDLLDRITAPSFDNYAIARERKIAAERTQSAMDNFVEEIGDPDEIRID